MKKLLSLLLVLCMLTMPLAGCGGGSGGGSNATPGADATAGPGNSASGDGARTDLIIAIDSDVSTLHVSDYASTNEKYVSDQIYDTLFALPVDGSLNFEPRLAESWEMSEDGLSYTFHLRKGVTFHDGSPFTAEDVKFSAELYQASTYQGAVVEGLSEVEVVNDHTVILKTEYVFSPFMENIATMRIASKAYSESASAEDFANKPVGTGPYRFVSHSLGSSVAITSYEDHFRGAPDIKDVTFRVLSDDATIAVSLQTNEIDFVKISEANFANLDGVDGITITEVPESRFGFISMNHEKEPFNNIKFRQAVAYAIDRQNLIDLAMDGIGTVNSNIISPLRFGYSEDQPTYDYNPGRAKELLAEIGIETPYDLGVMYISELYKTQAQVVQNDLANIGINVTLEIVEQNTLLQNMFNGDIGITLLSMVLEGTTQQYSMALTTPYVGMANNVRYSNPEVDELFDEASRTVNEDERFKIYDEIFTIVQEECVFVSLYNTVCLYAYNSSLNVPELPLEGEYHLFDFSWAA